MSLQKGFFITTKTFLMIQSLRYIVSKADDLKYMYLKIMAL